MNPKDAGQFEQVEQVEQELRGFFRRVPPPEPSAQLRDAVRAARKEPAGRRGRTAGSSLRSLAGLAATLAVAAVVLGLMLGRVGPMAGPEVSTSSPGASAAPSAASTTPTPTPTATATTTETSPSPVAVASPTIGPSPTPTASAAPASPSATMPRYKSGTFTSLGPVGHLYTNAALLGDGRVLLASDVPTDASGDGQAAEVFDPVARKSVSVGPTLHDRSRGTMTTLPDGRVLLEGGTSTEAEIFDASTMRFTATGKASVARYDESSIRLADGRVLIVGGRKPGSGAGSLSDVELFDPATGQFHTLASMRVARARPMLALLADGRVLVAGGEDAAFRGVRDAEVYDPSAGTFVTVGSMLKPRELGTATTLSNGQVLVAGGYDDDMYELRATELFNPETGTFRAAATLPEFLINQTATLLQDGRVLIAGGLTSTSPTGGCGLAQPPVLAMARGLFDPAPTPIPGGIAATCQGVTKRAAIYDPQTNRFTATGNLTVGRTTHHALLLPGGQVLLAGGDDVPPGNAATPATIEVYTP